MFVADHRKLLYLYPCGKKKNRNGRVMSSHFIWKNQTTKKKTLPSSNTVLFQFYLIPQNPWIYSCWAGNCSCDHLECRVLALTTLFAFFKIDLDRPLFLFWSGYEVARGRISVNMTGKLVFFSLKAELCFLAKHVCLRFARHFNYKRIKLYSQRHNATTIIMQFFYVNDVTWPKHFY